MEKLKFAVQVFTVIMAFPVLTMVELHHGTKSFVAEHKPVQQQPIKIAEGYYFKTSVGNTAAYPQKPFTRRYCK